jgi:hypothetical protein
MRIEPWRISFRICAETGNLLNLELVEYLERRGNGTYAAFIGGQCVAIIAAASVQQDEQGLTDQLLDMQ